MLEYKFSYPYANIEAVKELVDIFGEEQIDNALIELQKKYFDEFKKYNNKLNGNEESEKYMKDKNEVNDEINHPAHYTNSGMECIDEMILLFGIEETMSFCKLNAWKYRKRAFYKGGETDIKKSDWYIAKYKELKDMIECNCSNNDCDDLGWLDY